MRNTTPGYSSLDQDAHAPAPAVSKVEPPTPRPEQAHGDDHLMVEHEPHEPAAVTATVTRETKRRGGRLLDHLTSDQRKEYPIASGVLDYFPDAIAAVANVSFEGNRKHNPGQPLHWARGKSMDHADCIGRHVIERDGFDGKLRHSACLAWRALALLQEELEAELGLDPPRNAR